MDGCADGGDGGGGRVKGRADSSFLFSGKKWSSYDETMSTDEVSQSVYRPSIK